jgi:membrane protein required for colicin V production
MEGFTLVDAGVAGVIILSAILAYSRGFVREAMAIAGWIGAAILAFIFAPAAQPLIKELPVVGDFLRDSCELSIIAAAAGVFALGLIVAAIFTPLFSSAVQRSALGGIDQGAGFLFGVVRGIILVVIAFIVYDRALANQRIPMVDDSRSQRVFANFQERLNEAVPSDAPGWVLERYNQLTEACVAPGTTTAPEAAPAAPADGAAAPAEN